MYKLKDTFAIVVLYAFDELDIKKNVDQFLKNFNKVILINNSPEISLNLFKSKKIIKFINPCNVGLAISINKGIQIAINHGARLVTLFDQDTCINDSFNQTMLSNINSQKDTKTALYAPLCFNRSSNNFLPQYYVKKLRVNRVFPDKRIFVSYPDFVITSGSYIPLNIIEDLGFMDENFFINYIDIEWCLRARSKGYQILSFSNCQIEHNIGDYSITVFNQKYPIHSPQRMYYSFRNAIYCYSLRHISFSWKIIDFTRNIPRFLFYMLFVKNRWTYLKYIIKGNYHGLMKKMGKLEE